MLSLLIIIVIYGFHVNAQRNMRNMYLDDPKGVITGNKRMIDQVAEFTDLGYDYENGNIWPKPQHESRSDKLYTLDPKTFKFVFKEKNWIIKKAINRYKKLTFPNEHFRVDKKLKQINTIDISIEDLNEPLTLESNESYILKISYPRSTLEAKSIWGALRGLETFSQVVHRNGSSYVASETVVRDFPRFKYRGFLIDTSRHFLPVSQIFQILDALAYSKFNVLHWHIVDDQSFPFVSKKFPELHKKGAFNEKTHVYNPKQVQDIIHYAKLLGIRVVPEFNTPGHTHSWNGIPGLLTECSSTNQREKAFEDMKGPINPIKNASYVFLKDFFAEISEVFPDEFIHIGGDEVDFKCWLSNSEIKKWLANRGNGTNNSGERNEATLHKYYFNKLIKIIDRLKKKYIVWQDVFESGAVIEKDAIVNVWKHKWKKEMSRVTKAGHKVVLSSCWYLNYVSYGLDWPKFYTCDPQGFNGTKKEKDLVIGGSCAIWGEYVDATNIIQRSFGRAFAVAERLWSSEDTVSISEALIRIWEHRCRYIDRGIPTEPVTRSKFCRNEYER
ncbi:beta-hexosaminidase subunit alpha isoform X1 [Hydra vulgaris]|uniref:beta-hexosaminidase subunit alpha isoform X1 n=1 Tax=Hydra vulgaris TaxID=6087 RepID=UPI001F5EC050|nr:beta-hexosaminidase subunit alpha [Hydra vulgaris]